MEYNRDISISIGSSRMEKNWRTKTLTIEDLYKQLKTPHRGVETMQEYLHLSKDQQAQLKDVGGFVGGTLAGPRRKAADVTGRDLITLDFDNIPGWQTKNVVDKCSALHCSYCVYSTRKHDPAKPRLRIIIPLDRTVTPDEYEPCARRVAAYIGIGMADKTTFEPERLMYWPSCCADSEYVYEIADAPLMSAEFLLSTYIDWHDMASWPMAPGEINDQRPSSAKQDPREAKGIVGEFCRTYDIYSALDKFLPGVYTTVDAYPDRLTYAGGSTSAGAVVYGNGLYLYSHHATDPCGGKLVNAFDLVRLHLFGDKDADAPAGTRHNRLPSYEAMCELADEDPEVRATRGREFYEELKKQSPIPATADDDNGDWVKDLDFEKSGALRSTIGNALVVLENDPELRGKFAMNSFAGRGEVLGSLPWNPSPKRRLWADADNSGIYWYFEKKYRYKGCKNIDYALDIHAEQHAFNDVQNYINGLTWDGTPRLDTLLIDYLSAEDTDYNRAVCRKAFTAAVARAMDPGCKYDNMLILSGPQGAGKSTVLDKMSRGWFNDSIRTFEGKDASELLQGVWIVEIQELEAFRKTEVSRIKQFLSLRVDRYRAAYGRHVRELPRCCVFFGSTNTSDFLQDTTGNRRFWPVDVGPKEQHAKSPWTELTPDMIDQLWAEAKQRWIEGEKLYLTGELEEEAKARQEGHREVSVREGMIADFVEQMIPVNWGKMDIDRRRDWWYSATHGDGAMAQQTQLEQRNAVTAIEIWVELLGGSPRDMKPADTREINAILANLKGWHRADKPFRAGPYKVQRGFERD